MMRWRELVAQRPVVLSVRNQNVAINAAVPDAWLPVWQPGVSDWENV
jgi:hypothetical protein